MARTRVFEEHSAAYDAWFDAHPAVFASEVEAVRALLPPAGSGIEIGAGTGRFATALGIRLGVEPAGAMRVVAEARGLDMVGAVAESLPIESDSFDYALMVTTVCFLDDVDTAFRETFRILKPGGAFVAAIIDRTSPLGQRYERHKEDSPFYRDAQFHSTDEIVVLMRNAGFEDFAFRQTLFRNPDDMDTPDEVMNGYGEGAFVAIRGLKTKRSEE